MQVVCHIYGLNVTWAHQTSGSLCGPFTSLRSCPSYSSSHFVSNAPSGFMPPATCDCDTQRVGGRIFRRRRILASSTGRSTNSRRISTFNGTGQQSNSPKANWPKRIRPQAFFRSRSLSKARRVPQRLAVRQRQTGSGSDDVPIRAVKEPSTIHLSKEEVDYLESRTKTPIRPAIVRQAPHSSTVATVVAEQDGDAPAAAKRRSCSLYFSEYSSSPA